MNLASAYSSEDGIPRTRLSAVAVFDMLGFSAQVRKAHEDGRANELLERLKATLDSWYEVTRGDGGLFGRRFWELKAFTDNVVLGIPVQQGAEEQALSHVLSSVASLQRGLLLEGGFFVRGGIAFGDLYVDDDIVYGTGLLDAYHMEAKVAIVPRIVLHQSAAILVPDHARRYGDIDDSPQGQLLLQDEDGCLFVNYLAEEPEYEWLPRHRDLIQENLETCRSDAKIFSKYLWVARYHNYICALVPGAAEYNVPLDHVALRAKRLSEIVKH